jgi:cobalt/nickel transport protein
MGGVLLALAFCAAPGQGHYHMLLPSTASAKKGEKVTFTFQFGHPFEHQLFDAEPPEKLLVVTPDRKKTDLTKQLEKISLVGDKGNKVSGYRLTYTPERRGDHVFVLRSAPVWMEEEKYYVQDTVKVVLHVQAQKNWDADSGLLELMPLTRPYGLTPGLVFQAEMTERWKPIPPVTTRPPVPSVVIAEHPFALALAEVERYNPTPPAKLPPDEHITRTLKLDRQAKLVTTLPEAGWWALTVTSPYARKHKVKEKELPLRFRSTLWVYVDEAGAGGK